VELFSLIIISLCVLLVGFFAGKTSRKRPELFWRYLIVGTFATYPLAVGGYTWYDELFAFSFIVANSPIKILSFNNVSRSLFLLFLGYMVCQSLRGMVVVLEYGDYVDSIRKVRWPMFFLLIFYAYNRANVSAVRNVCDLDLSYKITVFSLIFHGIYILWGVAAYFTNGSTDYTQYAVNNFGYKYFGVNPIVAIWGSTAYVASMLPVLALAVIKTLFDPMGPRRVLAWIALFVMIGTEIFFNSRVGGFSLAATLLVAAPRLGIRRIAFMGVVAVSLVFIASYALNMERSIEWYMEDMQRTLLLDDRGSNEMQDIDRKVWFYSAIPALTDNVYNFVFGYGYRTSGRVVAPYVFELFESYGVKRDYAESVGTEGITNYAVDTGVLGLAMFIGLFVSAAFEIVRVGGVWKWVSVFALVQMFGWLFVINNTDVLPLFLIIMPAGILAQLNKKSSVGNAAGT